jgi:hypothetical protein
MVQGITGIPHYYRQFGYEMALELGGGRSGYGPNVPRLEEGQEEPYRVRPAAVADLPAIIPLYEMGCRRSLVSCVRDEALWRYEIAGMIAGDLSRQEVAVIETREGNVVGFLAHFPLASHQIITAMAYELGPGVSWLAVTPSVVRYLWQIGEVKAARSGKGALEVFQFTLGTEHPVYRALERRLPRIRRPYAWYLRVPDLPGFLGHIAPALERRLEASVAAGHTGRLKISLYGDGLQLAFEQGRLVAAEPWQPPDQPWNPPAGEECHAAFPGLTILQLVFGYRSLEEMERAFPDLGVYGDDAHVVLDSLFPKHASSLWAVV